MKLVQQSDIPWTTYEHPREGTTELKVLATGAVGPGANFFFVMVRYGSNGATFRTPRHRHTFDQIRLAVEGDINFGRGMDLPEGWVGYFPAGTPYGPQVVERGTLLGVQFGEGYLSEAQKRLALSELSEVGEFRDGLYYATDPSSGKAAARDGMEAMWEHITGSTLRYPAPRYREPVLIDPTACPWSSVDSSEVARRHLATFGDQGPQIEALRWSEADSCCLSGDRAQLAYVLGGRILVDGIEAHAGAALWSDVGEDATIDGDPGAELMVWGLPLPPSGG